MKVASHARPLYNSEESITRKEIKSAMSHPHGLTIVEGIKQDCFLVLQSKDYHL